jgi:hypothetical protein
VAIGQGRLLPPAPAPAIDPSLAPSTDTSEPDVLVVAS